MVSLSCLLSTVALLIGSGIAEIPSLNSSTTIHCDDIDVTTSTCTITLDSALEDSSNIWCGSYSHCDITCNAANSCSTNIVCPLNGKSCTIHCQTSGACSNATVYTGNCSAVEVHIRGDTASLQAFAPQNSSSLLINVSADITFEDNLLSAFPETNDVTLRCDDAHCDDNIIHCGNISGKLDVSCTGTSTSCESNIIHCPDGDCDISCDSCPFTTVTTPSQSTVEWDCSTNCTSSKLIDLSTNTTIRWRECQSVWSLVDECDPITTSQIATENPTTTSSTSDQPLDQFTILAFVLIGTVIGCCCVILVTTMVCCICWHQQNLEDFDKTVYDDSKSKTEIHDGEDLQRHRQISQSQTDPSSASRSQYSTTVSHLQQNSKQHAISNGYNNHVHGAYRSSGSPDSDPRHYHNYANAHHHGHDRRVKSYGGLQPNQAVNPHTRNRPGSADYPHPHVRGGVGGGGDRGHQRVSPRRERGGDRDNRKRGGSGYKQAVMYDDPVDTTSEYTRSSQYRHGVDPSQSSTVHQHLAAGQVHGTQGVHRGSKGSRTKSTSAHNGGQRAGGKQGQVQYGKIENVEMTKWDQREHERERERAEQRERERRKQAKREEAKKKVSFHDAEEELDTVAPLKNDIFAQQYDEYGKPIEVDIYANRKQAKEEIRMALEAFPSNVSQNTTTTADMNFVGNNYNEYRGDQAENSYFKEEGFCPVEDNLSLGNLDSQTTAASSIGMGGSMLNVHENALNHNNNSGGTYDRYQRHDQGQQDVGHHYQSNIKIIEPQHDQSKVAAHRKKKKGGGGGKGKHLKTEKNDAIEESQNTGSYKASPVPSALPISEMGTGDSGGYYK